MSFAEWQYVSWMLQVMDTLAKMYAMCLAYVEQRKKYILLCSGVLVCTDLKSTFG